MNKALIKVIKKDKKDKKVVSESSQPVRQDIPEPADIQITAQRQMASVVKSWVDGRIANRRTEERAASKSLGTWKTTSEHSKELSDDS